MKGLRFDNRFVRDLPGDPATGNRVRQVHGALWSRVEPTPVAAPRLVAHSAEVAALIGLDESDVASPEFARVFGGNALVDGMEPYAANYGGHQFGHWAGQLGDGRAITLGETLNAAGERWELQLKGAGPTPYSRGADGRAVLRSSVREFLCSEAMFHLGVPTTRALSLVATGDLVTRDMFYDGNPKDEPGAIVCRVAPSFIRFGNFELPSSRGDVALLKKLVAFTIDRDYPELASLGDPALQRAAWFEQVCERTAIMVAHWMRVGFVHGVMNTDNMSILGLTIDYGPYGWIDDFDPNWTPNTTDAGQRRYRFGMQPEIAYWNLQQLAKALAPAFGGTEALESALARYVGVFNETTLANTAAKLGFTECGEEDLDLMHALYELLEAAEVDMTIFFRGLADVDVEAPALDALGDAFYDGAKRAKHETAFNAWLARWAARAKRDGVARDERRARMNAVNPKYVLRNYLAQEAIDRAEKGDEAAIHDLLQVLRRPYDDQPPSTRFALDGALPRAPSADAYAKKRPDWARTRAGCSMLSCSS